MCRTPVIIGKEHKVTVPCGRCDVCTKRKIAGWSFRLVQQDRISETSSFITLTYANNKVPISKAGFLNLDKRDLQLFFKRLRKSHTDQDIQIGQGIKYYAVGEYGGRTNRPHYHLILFNAAIELIQPSWDLGYVHYGGVEAASVGYTLKYISKPGKAGKRPGDDRQREFSLMSKGLGLNYINSKTIKWHKADLLNRMYLNIEDGKKIAMPRYYKDKIYSAAERSEISGYQKGKIEERILEETRIQIAKGDESWRQYHHSKMEAAKAAFVRMEYSSLKTKI